MSVHPDSHYYSIVEVTQRERRQCCVDLKSFALNQVVYGSDCSGLLEGRLKDFYGPYSEAGE